MNHRVRLSVLILPTLALACGAADAPAHSDADRNADSSEAPDASSTDTLDPERPKRDAGVKEPTGCDVSLDGTKARALPVSLYEPARKLIAAGTRVIVQDQYNLQTVAKVGDDQFSYFAGFNEITDVTTYGDAIFVLGNERVVTGPVSGGELQSVMYNADGGRSLYVDADYIYVAGAIGDDSPLWRGPHQIETDIYGAVGPEEWLHGPSMWNIAGSATSLFLLSYARVDGTWYSGVSSVDKQTGTVSDWGAIPTSLPTAFAAEDGQAIVIAHDDGADDDELLGWKADRTLAPLARGKKLHALAVDATYAYFVDDASLKRVRRDGSGGATTVFAGTCAIDAITVDSKNAYFATSGDSKHHDAFAIELP